MYMKLTEGLSDIILLLLCSCKKVAHCSTPIIPTPITIMSALSSYMHDTAIFNRKHRSLPIITTSTCPRTVMPRNTNPGQGPMLRNITPESSYRKSARSTGAANRHASLHFMQLIPLKRCKYSTISFKVKPT